MPKRYSGHLNRAIQEVKSEIPWKRLQVGLHEFSLCFV